MSGQRVDDDREVITIGFSELEEAEAEAQLQRIGPQEQRRHERIDAVIEPDMTRRFTFKSATTISRTLSRGSNRRSRLGPALRAVANERRAASTSSPDRSD